MALRFATKINRHFIHKVSTLFTINNTNQFVKTKLSLMPQFQNIRKVLPVKSESVPITSPLVRQNHALRAEVENEIGKQNVEIPPSQTPGCCNPNVPALPFIKYR